MRTYPEVALQVPQLYLPRSGTDLTRWAVIACDQFTSEPDYWQKVEALVGDQPSTYHLVLPEIFLGKTEEFSKIDSIHETMEAYLHDQVLEPHEGLVYVERILNGKTRCGLMACLDLESYDYKPGSTSLIRATEGTILERLPSRMKIRTGAMLELPHILVLIDDPQGSVIEPLAQVRDGLEKLYDFELMLDSGNLAGYAVSPDLEQNVIAALHHLAEPAVFDARYGLDSSQPVLLYAMGDGNHSFATAKAAWERIRLLVGPNHPARFALVELENLHDPALQFEPIHRVLFDLKQDLVASLQADFGADLKMTPLASIEEMTHLVEQSQGSPQTFGMVNSGQQANLVTIDHPRSNLAVGSLQVFLDKFMERGGAARIDYIHGREAVCRLGSQPGNAGFYLPAMQKSDLFKTLILDGVLPRKTFSMGAAREKRFYMEARKIIG